MSKARISYLPEMRESEHGSRLYSYWKKVKDSTDSPEFKDFPSFYKWAMDADYSIGAKLYRRDATLPYSPDNCVWIFREERPRDVRAPEWEKLWDETVNRIRRHYDMEPIYSSEV